MYAKFKQRYRPVGELAEIAIVDRIDLQRFGGCIGVGAYALTYFNEGLTHVHTLCIQFGSLRRAVLIFLSSGALMLNTIVDLTKRRHAGLHRIPDRVRYGPRLPGAFPRISG